MDSFRSMQFRNIRKPEADKGENSLSASGLFLINAPGIA